MATLVVNATADFSADILSNIDLIDFTNTVAATASFAAAQFDNTAILDDVTFSGSAASNAIAVTGGSIDASSWQFEDWVFGDTITLTGTGLADTMTGSSLSDVITGGADADELNGGGGNDRFLYLDASDSGGFYESVDGGSGDADKILLDGSFDDLSLLFASITNVEKLVYKTSGFATFGGAAFGTGNITMVTGSSGVDELEVRGSIIDLSAVTFRHWTGDTGSGPRDFIFAYGLGSTSDTITGSSLADLVHGFDGDDVLNGGGGDDILYGDEGRDDISGGTGNDTIEYIDAAKLEDGEVIAGDGGTDTLKLHAGAADITYDFTGCIISGMETLSVIGPQPATGTLTVEFMDGQFGFGGISSAILNSPVLIVITAGTIDLSAVDFSGTLSTAATLLTGNSSADVLVGGALTDIIVGGSDVDVMQGKTGDDTFRYVAAGDINGGEFLDGDAGSDTIELSATFTGSADLSVMIINSIEHLAMRGSGQTALLTNPLLNDLDDITGAAGIQTIALTSDSIDLAQLSFISWNSNDKILLTGTAAADAIIGSDESDTITGLGDGDDLTGGRGADIFVFTATTDSTEGSGRDLILDFTQGDDLIDVAAFGTPVDFIAEDSFSGSGTAELRYTVLDDGKTQIVIDADGDSAADSRILLATTFALEADDFIL